MTTREVSDLLGVDPKTLQYWAREGHIRVNSSGEGRGRRIDWTPEAVEQARRVRDRCPGDSSILHAVGPELQQALELARKQQSKQYGGDVIVASTERARIFRGDTTLSEVLRKVPGSVCVVLGRG